MRLWNLAVEKMAKNHEILRDTAGITTQSLILSSTIVVSIFSNLLIEANFLGRVPVSWMSEDGLKEIRNSLKNDRLTSFPFAEAGNAIDVRSPDDFLHKVISGQPQFKQLVCDFKVTERAVNAILKMAIPKKVSM